MTHTPPVLRLSDAALDLFLSLLPSERVTRTAERVIIHADAGDAVWFARDGCWLTAAPGFETARRFGPTGITH